MQPKPLRTHFVRQDCGLIPGDVPNHRVAQLGSDQCLADLRRQFQVVECRKDAREVRGTRNPVNFHEAANPLRRLLFLEAVDGDHSALLTPSGWQRCISCHPGMTNCNECSKRAL